MFKVNNSSNHNGGGALVVSSLKQKMQTLREELERYKDLYDDKCREVNRERSLRNDAESQVMALTRRVELLEDERDEMDRRYSSVLNKLNDASKVVDEFERLKISNECFKNLDDEKISSLEDQIRTLRLAADTAEKKYDEAVRHLHMLELELGKSEERCELAESKARQLDNNLHILTSNLRSLEISEQTWRIWGEGLALWWVVFFRKLASKEDSYTSTIADLRRSLKESEMCIDVLKRELKSKQQELDKSEGKLVKE
ncbi:hypothetical protein HELRODRAFT_191748 [Helobdella robusta]|uniref:Uncharacterized protein n=1 Tax=Helobdella robusta TaxID=6412 RepID=T1FT95_HELRO|nr:hypothetical protein HELRODRAFT_191748 [Helobdella robusta]ESO04210.1 hypothetical protein HELRODRAFT_191748 [Helobdella robusta]